MEGMEVTGPGLFERVEDASERFFFAPLRPRAKYVLNARCFDAIRVEGGDLIDIDGEVVPSLVSLIAHLCPRNETSCPYGVPNITFRPGEEYEFNSVPILKPGQSYVICSRKPMTTGTPGIQ